MKQKTLICSTKKHQFTVASIQNSYCKMQKNPSAPLHLKISSKLKYIKKIIKENRRKIKKVKTMKTCQIHLKNHKLWINKGTAKLTELRSITEGFLRKIKKEVIKSYQQINLLRIRQSSLSLKVRQVRFLWARKELSLLP